MQNIYSQLLAPFNQQVAERQSTYATITERHIQALWLEQKYFRQLSTAEGLPIRVLSPGIWNCEAGPDFRKAHLMIGEREFRGDVEIHLIDESWDQHNHDEDERYNQVVLHLSLWKSNSKKKIVKKNGEEVATVYLEDYLTKSLSKITQLIDLDLYPYKKFLGSGKCSQKLFRNLKETEVQSFFRAAADWRLGQKKEYLASRLADKPMQMAGGIAMALGYKNNPEAFLELFAWLLDYRHLSEQEILAIAMGVCGFFDRKVPEDWSHSDYYQQLRTLWWGHTSRITHQTHLVLDHIRPYNHPVRRLAYLAKLLSNAGMENIWNQMSNAWKESYPDYLKTNKWALFTEALLSYIPSYEDAYWNHHYTFEKKVKDEFLPMIGVTLKTEILLNVFLPLLREELTGKEERQSFEAYYSSLRLAKTGKTEYLIHRFFGDTPKGDVLNPAQMQQGAYQLHRDFCVHFEASCEGCPFVERYHQIRSLSSQGNHVYNPH